MYYFQNSLSIIHSSLHFIIHNPHMSYYTIQIHCVQTMPVKTGGFDKVCACTYIQNIQIMSSCKNYEILVLYFIFYTLKI